MTKLSAEISKVIANYAKSNNAFSGRSGSSIDSDAATNLFQNIKNAVLSGCPVGFGTRKEVGPIEGRGKSAEEGMSRGIVGGHAYAVLGVFEENVSFRRKLVIICNPWNSYGR